MTAVQVIALAAVAVSLASAACTLAADVQQQVDQLNQREKRLIEKLEAIQQRERYIQTQLDEVRRRKQYLLDRRAVQKPGQPEAGRAATPTP